MTKEVRRRGKLQITIDGKTHTLGAVEIIRPGERPTDVETQLRHIATIEPRRRGPFGPERS